MEGLQEKLGRCKAGDTVEVVVKRLDNGEYKEITVEVELGNKKDAQTTQEPQASPQSYSENRDNWSGGFSFGN